LENALECWRYWFIGDWSYQSETQGMQITECFYNRVSVIIQNL